ncbi:MAG: hypothetical protein J0H40_23090 [Rhizobiales bacterium]|nr:hypothetical protein [Hyphomicrobiales bacterium]
MSRFMKLSLVIVLSLATATAVAAPRHKKKHGYRPHHYGFLPGYRQPLNNAAPLFKQEASVLRNARRQRRHWYIDPNVQYFNFYEGQWRYPGRPGFYRGRYNGGSVGPCWTQTPIGPVWTCG